MNRMNKIVLFILGISILVNIYIYIFTFDIFVFKDDGKEIERKWLISAENIPYKLEEIAKQEIIQTYINILPELRLRNINNGEKYIFTVKANMTEDGLVRDEKEYIIKEEEYNQLITKQEGSTIRKTRYVIYENEYDLQIDIYSDQLEGLAYLEIEFPNVEKAENFETPSWVIKEVTDDIRYKNSLLSIYGIPQ